MKLDQNNFHKNFQLNGNSFSCIDELLTYANSFSDEIYCFLESWFSNKDFISVQTSGSTGLPKQLKLYKIKMLNSAYATGVYFGLKEKTKALLCLSVKYIAGKMMLIRALTLGWHLDVIETNSYPLNHVDKTYDFCAMVPLQLENSIALLYKIKKLIVGGGVVSEQLQGKIQNSICSIYATYGMTETITHIAIKKLNNFKTCPNFYQLLPGVQVYKDERSCLVINAPLISNEFVFTNDVVNLISNTQFEWLGRFDNVVNSGSIKLHPEKIEEKLSKIIKNRFYVIGISDEKFGEKLILIIEGKPQEIDFGSTNLTKFEIPKNTFFLDEFIETETKKIQRKKTLDLLKRM